MWNTWLPQATPYVPVAAPTSIVHQAHDEQLRSWRELQVGIGHHRASLLSAILDGDVRGVQRLLLATTNWPEVLDGEHGGIYPLLLAARYGYASILQSLLAKGANVEASSPRDVLLESSGELGFPSGSGALRAAVSRANLEATRVLLSAGANPNAQDARGSTPLMAACVAREAGQRLAVVRQLLDSGAYPTVPNTEGLTALHFSAAVGDTGVMDLLIARAPGVVNVASGGGVTPLSLAVARGQEGAVACLLRHGASVKTALQLHQRKDAKPILVMAVDAGQEGIVRLLLDAGQSALDLPGAVHSAVWLGHARIARMLLAATTEEFRGLVARQDVEGLPMLHLAAASGSLAMVRVLLSAGADETLVDANGKRAADVIGLDQPPGEATRDPDTEAAIGRALERGPAFRARSLAWADVGCDQRRSIRTDNSPPFGVPMRVFRPRRRMSLVRILCRYAQR